MVLEDGEKKMKALINPAGELVTGETFQNHEEFQKYFNSKVDDFYVVPVK